MNISPNNSALVNGAGDEKGMSDHLSELQPETLHKLAHAYFGTDFPNSDRQACPDRATLLGSAQAGRLPTDNLRAHLFGCSACFTEYQTALAARTNFVPAITGQATPAFWQAWPAKVRAAFTLHPTLAWASVIALVIAALWVAPLRTRTGEHNANPQPGNTTELAQAQPTAQPSPTAPVEPGIAAPLRSTSATAVIVPADLNDYVALRDTTEPNAAAIQLRSVLTQLHLRLPEGSPAGPYALRLLDSRGQVVASASAKSRDGQYLTARLPLQGIAANQYQLQLQAADGPPALYPIRVLANQD